MEQLELKLKLNFNFVQFSAALSIPSVYFHFHLYLIIAVKIHWTSQVAIASMLMPLLLSALWLNQMKRRSVEWNKEKRNHENSKELWTRWITFNSFDTPTACAWYKHKSHSERLLASFASFIFSSIVLIVVLHIERKKYAKIKYVEEKKTTRTEWKVYNDFITRGPLWLFTIYICDAAAKAVVFNWLFPSLGGVRGGE